MNAGQELDELVAEKVMGWQSLSAGLYWDGKRSRLIKQTDIDRKRKVMGLIDSDGFAFSPSTDIAAAWEVVEKLKQQWFEPSITYLLLSKVWRVSFAQYGRSVGVAAIYLGSFDAYADTAPLAIALAALKAVGVEVKP